jgi:peptidoglycan hydrolase-like protein with peptidoglycan-binding domain
VRARVVAPLVAALLGITGGAVTAIATDTGSEGPKTPTALEDPLGLGIPMVSLECAPGRGLLILGYGDASGRLVAAVADNPGLDLSYVDTATSCDTNFGPERLAKPTYAVVSGPYADLAEPCAIRMTPEHRGDFVTNLRDGNDISVKCVCVLPETAAPELTPGMTATEAESIWIRSLQGMLYDLDEDRFPENGTTGVYDRRTEERIRELQSTSTVTPDGVVNSATWNLVRRRTCATYDF